MLYFSLAHFQGFKTYLHDNNREISVEHIIEEIVIGKIDERIDKIFQPIIDPNYRTVTFERFVEEWLEVPPVQVQEDKLTLFIAEDARTPLINALDPFTATVTDKENLRVVINGEEPNDVIKLECNQTSLVFVFRQVIDAGKIPSPKKKVESWLLKWFRVKTDDQYSELGSTIYDGLTKDIHKMKPAKESLINVNF
ncbi:hypothetical protein F5984_15205 [Rudanella paleaurantiibacter]|uniref:Uncharacterized protein n=1 Tax=Rudanella paleaurantiibacter TaxID=2614655 RepID=A0A7J5TZB3_9BACT|nr:hypothetical protein [Rudanella paleaurantiibacter]KAB7730488.1 hypothetical protein F5984_15205 [Rudanella paleaurantiibacter]